MGIPAPPSLVEAFCATGTLNVDYTVIPVPSQIGVAPENASFDTGFPPATFLPRTSGGIPPRGKDMNGILRMATAHNAWVAGGGQAHFNADVVSVQGGYNAGAVLQSTVTPSLFFLNTTANNVNDPDSVITGWVPFTFTALPTGIQTPATLAAGSQSIALTNAGIGFLELTGDGGGTSAILNVTGGVNGQILVISNTAAPFVTLLSSGNLRLPVDLTLIQNDSQSFRFNSTLSKWVKM